MHRQHHQYQGWALTGFMGKVEDGYGIRQEKTVAGLEQPFPLPAALSAGWVALMPWAGFRKGTRGCGKLTLCCTWFSLAPCPAADLAPC